MFFNGKYRTLKKMNYITDQQGIIERYLKEADSWATHLQNTKNAILRSARNKSNGNCAILGSGWLLDVPIDELSAQFEKVYLFDVIHPTQIRHKMRKYANVVLVEQDITGGAINEFFHSVQLHKSIKKRKELNEFEFSGFSYEEPFDFVASVNIINQLDILLIDYIRGYNLYTEDELNQLRKAIQQKHVDSLPIDKTCLVTDYEEIVCSLDNVAESKKSLLHVNLPQDKVTTSWQWQFDHQDYVPGKNVIFNVLTLDL